MSRVGSRGRHAGCRPKNNFSFHRIQGQNELFEVNEVVVVSIKEPENEMNISLKDIIYVSA